MSLTLFVSLLTILSLISSLTIQALKKTIEIKKPTLAVGIAAAICGWIGGIMAYILLGISFNPSSIICIILLAPAIWLTSTLGYDKVMEVINQIAATMVISK